MRLGRDIKRSPGRNSIHAAIGERHRSHPSHDQPNVLDRARLGSNAEVGSVA
jgi:hypothetical protein